MEVSSYPAFFICCLAPRHPLVFGESSRLLPLQNTPSPSSVCYTCPCLGSCHKWHASPVTVSQPCLACDSSYPHYCHDTSLGLWLLI